MLLKLLLIAAVLTAVYFIFFKKKSVSEKTASKPSGGAKESEMVECATCGTYITLDDALLKEGRYYCSRECLEK